jgi:hypothetical protein
MSASFKIVAPVLALLAIAACNARSSLGVPTPQAPVAAPGAIPQSIAPGSLRLQPTLPERVPYGASEVQYISNYYASTILEVDYPKGESPIGSVSGYGGGLCTKGARTFWVVTGTEADEFKVGGKSPVRVLKPAEGACAIDPVNGDLASFTNGGVIIFRHARGKGKVYGRTSLSEAYFDGYDGSGNLFLDGFNDDDAVELVELPKGSRTFQPITTSNTVEFPGSVQWDGTYLTVFDQLANAFYQYTISGTRATLKGTVSLVGSLDCVQTWIARPYAYCADAGNNDGEVYNYPAGGSSIATLTGPFDFPDGVVSLRVR